MLRNFKLLKIVSVRINMDALDDLGTYDGDTVHDMYVDYDYQINTGELGYVDEDIDEYIDNLNDWDL